MAFCPEAERLFALQHLEDVSAATGFDYHEVYDKLLEGVRHCLLEAASVLWGHEAEASSRVLATITLPTGAARSSLIWLQTQHRVAYQDRV